MSIILRGGVSDLLHN